MRNIVACHIIIGTCCIPLRLQRVNIIRGRPLEQFIQYQLPDLLFASAYLRDLLNNLQCTFSNICGQKAKELN